MTALVDFLGYGPASPTIIFVGNDEYCPRSAIDVNLKVRQNFPRRHDKNVACVALANACGAAGLAAEASKYREALVPGSVPQWNLAARLSSAFFRSSSWETEYRTLGTPNGQTFLAERFPLPRPSHWHRFADLNEKALAVSHREVLRRDLIEPLYVGSVVVSYAGRPTDLVGSMVRRGVRAWDVIARRPGGQKVEIAQTESLIVLAIPFPRGGEENSWDEWIGAAVAAVMDRGNETRGCLGRLSRKPAPRSGV